MNPLIREWIASLALFASIALLFAGKMFTALMFCACMAIIKWLLPKGRLE